MDREAQMVLGLVILFCGSVSDYARDLNVSHRNVSLAIARHFPGEHFGYGYFHSVVTSTQFLSERRIRYITT